jgi:hypothetical protein
MCWCAAYHFPHRAGGGHCNPARMNDHVWGTRKTRESLLYRIVLKRTA